MEELLGLTPGQITRALLAGITSNHSTEDGLFQCIKEARYQGVLSLAQAKAMAQILWHDRPQLVVKAHYILEAQ